ncbi:virulence-associated E family protein [Paenibacillus melissococcoides]|nr:virulence-associated E family protein [Paenibacillus melissococcoides]
MDWFTDSIKSFEGKEAEELIEGKWIVEIAELQAFSKVDVNRIKQFLSKEDDQYRAAYGRNVKHQVRRAVFFGTTNDHEYLHDPTGNAVFGRLMRGQSMQPNRRFRWKPRRLVRYGRRPSPGGV